MWDYSYNPKIMAMSIISVFALAYPMPPIYYIVRVAAWPLPLPPCPASKPAFMQYRRGSPGRGQFRPFAPGNQPENPVVHSLTRPTKNPQPTLLFALPSHFPSLLILPHHPHPLRGYNPSPLTLPLAVPRLPHLHGVYSYPLMTL